MRFILLCCMILLAMSACTREKSEVNDKSNLPCGTMESLDSVTVHSRLIGTWQLKRQSALTGQVIYPTDSILVQFSSPDTYKVTKNGAQVAAGNWGLVLDGQSTLNEQPVNMWRIGTSMYTEYLGGYVFVCGTELALIASFYDGIDQLYEKQ